MLEYNAITYISHNERNREQVEIERDATVWEIIQRIWRHRTFKISTDTLTVYERNSSFWVEKESQDAVDIDMFEDLNAYVEYTTSDKCMFW